MNKFFSNHIFRTATSLIALYWIAAIIIPMDILITLLNVILIAIAIAVTVSFFPGVIEAIRKDSADKVSQLILGIILSWTAVILNRSWSSIARFYDEEWMQNAPIVGFYIYLAILAGTLHITAPGALNGVVPKRNWITLGCAIASGFILFVFLVFLQH